jgi:cyclophilin family peptidyl-prolyl cis-trans isomerase/HEAT repeat protein
LNGIVSLSLCLLLMFSSLLPAQEGEQKKEESRRREKIEDILRVQDSRTPHDARLIALLGDRDPLVRERAILAFGSLQDSTRLDQMAGLLFDPALSVQNAAAFAIGQTAAGLSRESRKKIQEDLIWNRLSATAAVEALIQEMGKFGTEEALRQIPLRYATTDPPIYPRALSLSLARFAIRGVVAEEGVKFLLQRCRPADLAIWETVYALQKIGDHPLIRQDLPNILLLRMHREPLVRMNLAILLGQLHDDRAGLDPLIRMAEFDADWRVRVNALRALSSFNAAAAPSILTTFRRSAYDGNPLIAAAAFSAAGSTKISLRDSTQESRELLATMVEVARNRNRGYHMQVQGEAALALSKLLRGNALGDVTGSSSDDPFLAGQLMRAAGATGSSAALGILTQGVVGADPLIQCGALDGLQTLVRLNAADSALVGTAYGLTLHALSSSDVAVVSTAAGLLRDEHLKRLSSVEPLCRKLADLRVPDDIEAMQEIARTLGDLKDPGATASLQELLNQPDRSVAREAASALGAITGRDYTSRIVQRSEPLYTDYDFSFLESLPPTPVVTIETTRGMIRIELDPHAAPFTVMSFLKLITQRGFYRGRTFHRVVPNFVIQGGDPRGDGWGGPGYSIRSEFTSRQFETGTVGIASAGKDTEGSQFFITHSPQPHLDGRYTVFARVISGQDVVDRILIGDRIVDISLDAPAPGEPPGRR